MARRITEKFKFKSSEKNHIKITSNLIKTGLLCYYRFKCGSDMVCTEFSYTSGIADIMAITKTQEVVEVEIKISKADLLSEETTKAKKHKELKEHFEDKVGSRFLYSTPNRFYYCVPPELRETAIDFVNRFNPDYGVMICDVSQPPQESIIIVKPSHLLHKINVATTMGVAMEKRLSNMVSVLYRELYWTNHEEHEIPDKLLEEYAEMNQIKDGQLDEPGLRAAKKPYSY